MKVVLNTPASFVNDASAVALEAANNAAIAAAIENTLSRDGTSPSQMLAPLDMNSQRILNLPPPGSQLEPVRFRDLSLTGSFGVYGTLALQDANNVNISGGVIGSTVTGVTQAVVDNSTKLATTAYVDRASYKLSVFTRVLSTASGNQSVTGVGFKPRLIQFQTGISGGSTWISNGQSDGIANSSVEMKLVVGATGAFFQNGLAGIQRDDSAGANYNSFVVASLDADGFTVTWTKVGSPTATASINAICYR